MSKTTNITTPDDWIKTREMLPCESGQRSVIFCSPGWACARVGMFTKINRYQGEWTTYDQQNDCFVEFLGIPPKFWMYMPAPPSKWST